MRLWQQLGMVGEMANQKPDIWTRRGRNQLMRQLRRVQSPRRTGTRSETLMLFASLLSAIATTFAAVSAYYSVKAADRQEQATYESQLYNKQVDLVGVVFTDLMPFDEFFTPIVHASDSPFDLGVTHFPTDLFDSLLHNAAARTDFLAKAEQLHLTLESRKGVMEVTFPGCVEVAVTGIRWSLKDMIAALKTTPPDASALEVGITNYQSSTKEFSGYVMNPLHGGRPVTNSTCSDW